MILSNEKIKDLDGEQPMVADRYFNRTLKSKYQSDLVKGIVEIIKNGVDAYIDEKGEENCNQEEIKLVLDTKNDKVKVINYARGMNLDKFTQALKLGEDTSSEKAEVTGSHGYGMKEAAWAFKIAYITSIHEGRYSSRIFYWDEKGNARYAWDKEDGKELTNSPVNEQIISETGIKEEGTYFEAVVPDDIPCPRINTLCSSLSNHILLRTINQSDKFKIVLEHNDGRGNIVTRRIHYTFPEPLIIRPDRKAIDSGEFSFDYPNYGIIN